MTQREFTEYLTQGIGRVIKIDGPVTDYAHPRNAQSSEGSLGILLEVFPLGDAIPTGRTDLSAGNSVTLVNILIDGRVQTLWVSAKRVCFLPTAPDAP